MTFGLAIIFRFSFVLIGGVSILLALRWRRVQSPWTFVSGGVALGLGTYLTLVAMGMGAQSDRPMTFAENIARPVHYFGIAYVVIAGGTGGITFWTLAVRTRLRPLERT